MAKNNPVTHNIVHQQSFINKSINDKDFEEIENKEYYFKYECTWWSQHYCWMDKNHVGYLHNEYQKGSKIFNRIINIHTTPFFYIHIDAFIDMYNNYHKHWNVIVKKLIENGHPLVIINWLDFVKVTGQHEALVNIESILGDSKRTYIEDTYQGASRTDYIPENKPTMLTNMQSKYALKNVTDLSHIENALKRT